MATVTSAVTTDMADLPPLPPRKSDQTREIPPRPSPAAARATSRPPGKPDPRPMRVVYGAGAVAVASVIAVGLVQPDYAATADQQQTNDANAVADANAASDTAAANAAGANAASQGSSGLGRKRDVQVNHVTKYIRLKPGQTAPPGATVIYPGQPTPRVNVANQPAPTSPPVAPPSRNPTKPPVVHNPPPPTVHPTPPPTPRPTNKTHQSGRP